MVVLKKIKGSTLMETMVATVLIVVVFMLASMILNSLFSNTIKNNTRAIDTYLNEIKYLQVNNRLELPYQDDYKDWSIEAYADKQQAIIIEAYNTKTKQTITQTIFETK